MSFGTSLVMTSFVFRYLDYIIFLSCSRARKKRKLWFKPSDDFFCILLFKLYSFFQDLVHLSNEVIL